MAAVLLWVAVGAVPAGAALAGAAGASQALRGQWPAALGWLEKAAPEDREVRFYAAWARLELGFVPSALEELRVLSDTPGAFSGQALERGVDHLFRTGRYSEVLAWAGSNAIGAWRDVEPLAYRVGQSRFLTGDGAAALELLEQVTGPHAAYARHTLGLLYFDAGRLREAVDVLGSAVEAAQLLPGAEGALLAQRIGVTRGQVIYQVAAGAGAIPEAERRKLIQLAAAEFARVPATSPLYPDALRGTGWCSLELGDHVRALAAFETAAALAPYGAHQDLWAQGRVYQSLGYFEEAAAAYGEAARAARAASAAGRDGDSVRGQDPQGALWAAATRPLAQTTALLEEAQGDEERIAEGLAGWSARLARGRETLLRVGDRSARLREELHAMEANLAEHLDRIPASALFPRRERPRIDDLGRAQRALHRQVNRLEAVFVEFGRSRAWAGAGDPQRSRVAALWERLQTSKRHLEEAQLAFLTALKTRVSEREAELAAQIGALRDQLADLGGLGTAAEAEVANAEGRNAGLRARLADFRTRGVALRDRLGALREWLGSTREQARAAERQERAGALTVLADAYALDEAQALHLWKKGPAAPGVDRR